MERKYFISDNEEGGGIAFNVKALVKLFKEDNVDADLIFLNRGTLRAIRVLVFENKDVYVFTTSGKSLLLTSIVAILRMFSLNKTKITPIVYHPRFCDKRISKFRSLIRRALMSLPKGNVVYYCDEAKIASDIPDSLESKNIIGLCSNICNVESVKPVDFNLRKIENKIHLSTVGRMVDFKLGYLLSLVDFANENKNVHVSVIGFGPCEPKIKERAEGVDNITFYGKRTLEESKYIMEKSDYYVGMGTTLSDAKLLGLTPIVAIESDKDGLTTGFFGQSDEIHFGEYNESQSYHSLKYFLENVVSNQIGNEVISESSQTSPHRKLLNLQENHEKEKVSNYIKVAFFLLLSFLCRFLNEKDYHG
ncbi:hypothetical protein [Vibrio hangzhouensis]|uniref:hypothetical protein n=1 Tax=Vibrio hangzhouensis TaxID=462991 RepID=UPI001C986F6C|nr:hypothetical protein [Vibrio hangzhouensis]MBY6198476.1 hypothetical protein [Vibrio hangzhouensis]